MIVDVQHTLDRVVHAMERIDEDVYILRLRRPWFWRIRVWLLLIERRGLNNQATEITDRIRFRRGLP